ncbi:hypothetical protein ANN_25040 [Periplaneta americana]|uniref:Dipeptidase n=1 Tax=Periplaneta americana TaxID=6978 RepID=A0ABQ8S0C2_PERAM|nr:hypothetical protein ANN_25040 [Periplaneta americana]
MAGLCEGGNEPPGSLKLISNHNDLPWNVRKFVHNQILSFNFTADLEKVDPWARSNWSHTDLPRLRRGMVGAQTIKIVHYNMCPEMLYFRVMGFTTLKFTGTIPYVLEDTPLINRQQIHFLHDGAPAHFSRTARRYLDRRFPDRWIELRFVIGTHCCERVILVSVQSAASANATEIKDSRMQLRSATSAVHKRAAKCTQADGDILKMCCKLSKTVN